MHHKGRGVTKPTMPKLITSVKKLLQNLLVLDMKEIDSRAASCQRHRGPLQQSLWEQLILYLVISQTHVRMEFKKYIVILSTFGNTYEILFYWRRMEYAFVMQLCKNWVRIKRVQIRTTKMHNVYSFTITHLELIFSIITHFWCEIIDIASNMAQGTRINIPIAIIYCIREFYHCCHWWIIVLGLLLPTTLCIL